MSVRCMARVWAESTVGGSELLVLLAIADHAHDDGTGAWPSLNTIARKTKMSRRHVIRVIGQLEEKGELARESGAGPYGTNAYVVLSGLTEHHAHSDSCTMCGGRPNEGLVMEEHHPKPDTEPKLTVTLCKPCHIKLHNLLGSDKLSPPTDGSDTMSPVVTSRHQQKKAGDTGVTSASDMASGVVTPRVKTGDIAMSPKPSLTITDKPSEEPSLIWSKTLKDLEGQMEKATFDKHLRSSRLLSADNGCWQVAVPARSVDWLNHRMAETVNRILAIHAPEAQAEFVPG